MIWLLAGLATLALLLFSARAFANARIETLKAALRWTAGILGVALAGFLLFSGRGSQALVAVLFAGPLLMRFWKQYQATRTFQSGGRPNPAQSSRVETRTLRMELDHDSGTMQGTVLAGPFRGRELAELTLSEVVVLWRDCRADDPESVPLIEAWLDRAFPDWREVDPGDPPRPPPSPPGKMTRPEAYSVLGLAEGAPEAEIRAAYLRLMRTAHPDRGGSAWLAARLNEARSVLLGT
jgi:hypothetical protein